MRIILTVLILSLLVGCVRYSGGEPVEKQDQTEKVDKEEKTKEEPKEEEPKVDQVATDELNKYFEDNFFMTSWYELIEEITVTKDIVYVKTSVLGDDEGKKTVKNIASTVWGFTNTNDSKYHFKNVTIYDKDDQIILSDKNPLD